MTRDPGEGARRSRVAIRLLRQKSGSPLPAPVSRRVFKIGIAADTRAICVQGLCRPEHRLDKAAEVNFKHVIHGESKQWKGDQLSGS
jgi:hypothetical protein